MSRETHCKYIKTTNFCHKIIPELYFTVIFLYLVMQELTWWVNRCRSTEKSTMHLCKNSYKRKGYYFCPIKFHKVWVIKTKIWRLSLKCSIFKRGTFQNNSMEFLFLGNLVCHYKITKPTAPRNYTIIS